MEKSVGVIGLQIVVCSLVASFAAGCAARGPRSQRFVTRGAENASDRHAQEAAAPAAEHATRAQKEELKNSVARALEVAAAARPPRPEALLTIEKQDVELSSARLKLAIMPTAENQRLVAAAYLRLGVFDAAYDHYKAALRLKPKDAGSFDGLARVWRDWGLPELGLGDAYRAIFYAPSSATVHNTLGTILQRLGQIPAARSAFEAALRRDPQASYALNNLCYVMFLQGHSAQAIASCGSALSAEPGLAAAHNNLGLAYWVEGDRRSAMEAFAMVSAPGAARYNMGMALLGSGRFQEAAEAFDDATALSPGLREARTRALQARTLSKSAVEGPP